jgi:hypothetical protein
MLEDDHPRRRIAIPPAAFTLAACVFAVVCYVFDPGPAIPPFRRGFTAVDCRSIAYESHAVRRGAIDIRCRTWAPIEYPVEYLPHFLTAWAITDGNSVFYEKRNLANMSLVNATLEFSLAPALHGRTSVRLQCLEEDFAGIEVDFADVNDTDQDQHSVWPDAGGGADLLRNVCVEGQKIVFFVAAGGHSGGLDFHGGRFALELIGWVLPSYLYHHGLNRTNETAFLLPPLEPVPWKALLFNLVPLANLIDAHAGALRRVLFFFRETPPKATVELLRRFPAPAAAKMKETGCFRTLVLARWAPSAAWQTHETTAAALAADFGPVRSLFPKAAPGSGMRIALAEALSHLQEAVRAAAPGCAVVLLPARADPARAADAVVAAAVLIGNHISNLVHMAWLSPGRAVVIDASPAEVACNDWVQQAARRNNLSYFPIAGPGECACPVFECYPAVAAEGAVVDVAALQESVQRAVAFVRALEPPPTPTPVPLPSAPPFVPH